MNKRLDIRKAIHALSSQEAKQLLAGIKLQLDLVELSPNANIDLYKNINDMYEQLLVPDSRKSIWEPDASARKVHIVFGDSAAASLKLAMKQLGDAEASKMVCFRDLFSIGPLWRLHEERGRAARGEWFKDHINSGNDDDAYDDYGSMYHQRLDEQMALIPDEASIVIWSGGNAHEQAGLRYAMYLLKERNNPIFTFHAAKACERRFSTADRQIRYSHTGEISPELLQEIVGEAEETEPLPRETRRLLEQEWLSLAERGEVLRTWDGERIINVREDHYDAYLLEAIDKLHTGQSHRDFIKAARVIGEALGSCEQYIGDSYLEYRLRQLIYNGVLDIKGVPRAMRYYSVRRK
ncbi:DUF1835 domain-containing protein [Paenibacillus doosanensis]|uniref:DUF1835 domain-containing protein n=1 Tax=Paenibacillus doosanensis TaxID=1229154 RepID=UPI00217FEFB9|nr:DUF1835 domain-containing protein [Paenibacillus doosanensis]MCS7460938.1 DUF1835 domain-containing protein [Paenibacillus doosanensis]